MIQVPVWTVEKPISVIDYLTPLLKITVEGERRTVAEVRRYAMAVPSAIREDDRFGKAVADALKAIHARKAAA